MKLIVENKEKKLEIGCYHSEIIHNVNLFSNSNSILICGYDKKSAYLTTMDGPFNLFIHDEYDLIFYVKNANLREVTVRHNIISYYDIIFDYGENYEIEFKSSIEIDIANEIFT